MWLVEDHAVFASRRQPFAAFIGNSLLLLQDRQLGEGRPCGKHPEQP
jgi:hypothetical protein